MIYKKGRKSECKGVLTNYFKHLKILSNWLMINESGAEISAQPAEVWRKISLSQGHLRKKFFFSQ